MTGGKMAIAGAYLRLSNEDGDKQESNSISGQRELIRQFAASHPDLTLAGEYVDDGYSGTDFERPSFKRLVADCEAKKINCIIVKDLSRLGRNYIETGRYLERVFPLMGVRFIAVTDNYDSLRQSNAGDDIIVPFKNLINDAYCRDISVKVRSQQDVKRRSGQFIGAFAVYGYRKDENDKNKLVIDEEAACVVRMIFSMKMDGFGNQAIADRLNAMGVLTPFEYKRSKNSRYASGFHAGTDTRWMSLTVDRILKNEMYIGTMVQGKSRKLNYKIKKIIDVAPENWIRVENTHDAIISEDIFRYVQELSAMDTRTSPGQKGVYLFSGFLKCGDCGQNMIRRQVRVKDKAYHYYHCSTFRHFHECTSHSIKEEKLERTVLHAVQMKIAQVAEACEIIDRIESLPSERYGVKAAEQQIESLRKEEERYQNLKAHLYQDMVEGLITREEYRNMGNRFSEKISEITKKMEVLIEKRAQAMQGEVKLRPWMESMKKYSNLKALDRKVLIALVDHIDVFEGGRIEIHFRFEDELEDMLAAARQAVSEEREGAV